MFQATKKTLHAVSISVCLSLCASAVARHDADSTGKQNQIGEKIAKEEERYFDFERKDSERQACTPPATSL
jgi:hypothetical protein